MKKELARVYVEQTEDLNAALHKFVSMQAAQATFTAQAWDKVHTSSTSIHRHTQHFKPNPS
jgi:hypothetical protein